MKKYASIFVLVLLVLPAAGAGNASLLPQSFDGWHKSGATAKTSSDPVAVNPADAAVLKEYGFRDAETATYVRDGRTIQIKAVRFPDATGAYGAFTFYAQPEMQTVKIGDQGVSAGNRVLFYRGNILVDATVERMTAMTAANLRTLAETLPPIGGNSSTLPSLPGNLPRQSLVAHSQRYIIGPAALERLGVPVPASLVDFANLPEVATAKYSSSLGEAGLTLIDYHTPPMAREKIKVIQAAALPGGPFYYKRTGPIVAIVNGQVSASEAEALLASVNYDAEVTMNQPTKPTHARENVVKFLVTLILLTIFMVLFAFVFGFLFGGLKVVAGKLFPNTVLDRTHAQEVIRLNLK
ncbi:MAG TPA: DUF6599 family protein [Verrucomicrobiae bacterium]|jgi:hypothetical protein|nr:DUF6599 family protein [Verrucomicrobiae bacterium]